MKSRLPSCFRGVDEESYWLEFQATCIWNAFLSLLEGSCLKSVAMATEEKLHELDKKLRGTYFLSEVVSQQLCHFVGCVIRARRLENYVISVRRSCGVMVYFRQCLTAWLLLRWIDGAPTAAREGCSSFVRAGPPLKERRFNLGTFRSVRKYFIDNAKTIVFA
ncbi:hypothetical protein TNCV_755661 [Trichonephila clavipes]|nr:hypothetical protein TNCV_755661 [Trichonephila clavipes]